MKILVLIIDAFFVAQAMAVLHHCEPQIPSKWDLWRTKYFIDGKDKIGFKQTTLRTTYYHNSTVEHYRQYITMLEVGAVQPFRKWEVIKMYNFLHGDAAVVHAINTITGEYTRTEIGEHTGTKFVAVGTNNWHAIDVLAHPGQNFIVLGVILVDDKNYKANLEWAKRSELIQKFPQHAEVIRKFTPDEEK